MTTPDIFDRIQGQQQSELDIFDQIQQEQNQDQDIFDRIQSQEIEQLDIFDRVQKEQADKQKEERLSPFAKARKDVQQAGAQLTENLFEQVNLDPEIATLDFAKFLESIADKESRFAINDANRAFESGIINQKQLDSVIKIERVKEAVEFASIDTLDRDLRKNQIKIMEEKGNITPELSKSLQIMIEEQPNLLVDELKGIASGLTFTLSELITGPAETSMGTMGTVAGSFLNLGSIASRVAKPLINLTKEAGPVAQATLPAFFRVTGWGVEGATRKGIETLVREKELPTATELVKEGASWAALAGILEGAGLALEFGGAVNRIAKDFGISRKEVLRRVVKGVEKRGRDFMKGPEVITPDEILEALDEVKVAEEALQIEQKPIEIAQEETFQNIAKGEKTLGETSQELEDLIKKTKNRLEGMQKPLDPIEKATISTKQVGSPGTLETRGEGRIFHGSRNKIDSLEEGHYSSLNYYGQGLYTTDALDIAEGYSKAKRAKDPTIYEITEKKPVKLLDLEQKLSELPKEVQDIYSEHFEIGENTTFRELYDNFRDEDMSANDIQEIFQGVQEDLERIGYHGLRHEGGRLTGREPHDVKIYFSPEKDLEIKKIDLPKPEEPEDTVSSASTIRIAERKLADINAQKKQGKKPSGLSKEAEEEIVSENREQISPEEQATFQDSQNDSIFVNALLKDDFSKKLEETWNNFGFNVERPFQQSNAPETGFRIKNYFSELAKKEEQTLEAIKKLEKLTKKERSELALLAEKKTPPIDPKLAEAWHVVRNFFDDTFKELQKAKVLKHPFPESYILRLQQENDLIQQRLKEKTLSVKEAQPIFKENLKLIKELQNINFVSIPVRLWFEKEFVGNPSGAVRAVRLVNQRKRKTPTIAGMIEAGIIKPEQVDIAEIMAFYGRRTARDLGLSKIINAAEKEGLSSRKKIPGFIEYPAWQYPALKGNYLHPKFSEWLDTFVNPTKMGIFGKASSMVKGFAFYNPIILPFNDLVQQIMLTGIQGSKYWKLAANDILNKSPEFWEAYENGLFSQPFNIFYDDYELIWKASLSENKTLPAKMRQWFIQEKGVNAAYRVSSNIAWAGDRVIRMASYRRLLETGMNPREAAQTAALFHGDYAMVHPTTRKRLNLLFFVPTFKIVMGKLYSEMLKAPVRVGKAITQGKAPSGVDKRKFWGLLGTLSIIMAFDQLYTKAFGFERVQLGRQYKKSSENDEGVEKDLTINLSNPATLPFKFFWRIIESFDTGKNTAISDLIRKNRYEINPILNLAERFVQNEKADREPIYESFGDDSLTKVKKSLIYASQELFPLFKVLNDETFEDPEARKKLEEEIGLLMSSIPGQFVYFGSTEEQKKLSKINQVTKEFYKRAMQKAKKKEEMTEKELKQYQKVIEEIAS